MKTGKAEFDKLSPDDMRNKKVYYESGYKLTKGETESDLTKYLGGKVAHEELINNIKDVIESYKWMYALTALTVVASIVLFYVLISLIKVNQATLTQKLYLQVRHVDFQRIGHLDQGIIGVLQ